MRKMKFNKTGLKLSDASRSCGFTLVELLVVISIVGLLMSILLPVLKSARETAQGIKCAANIRQIGLASQMYVNDHKLYMPLGIIQDTSITGYIQNTSWVNTLIPYMNRAVENSQIVTRTPKNEWWFCESAIVQGVWNYPHYGINFTIAGKKSNLTTWSNGTSANDNNGTWAKQITRMRKPGRSLMFGEFRGTGTGYEYMANVTVGHANDSMRYPHKDVANVIFFDNHVQQMKRPAPGEKLDIAPESIAAGSFTRRLWE